MADTVSVGGISVDIELDTTKLDKGKRDAERGLRDFSKNSSGIISGLVRQFAGLAAGVIGVATAVAALRTSLADARELTQLSQATGASVEQLTALRFAAQQSGVEFSTLTTVMAQFNQRMLEMGRDVNSTGQMTFRALGISIRDSAGNLRSILDILPEVADKFSRSADGANKAAVATVLFGEAGARLIPFLNKGSQGIEELKKEAERLGIVLDTEGIKRVDEFNKQWDRFASQVKAASHAILEFMLPALTKLAGGIRGSIDELKLFGERVQAFSLIQVNNEMKTTGKQIESLVVQKERLNELSRKLGAGTEDWTKLENNFKAIGMQIEQIDRVLKPALSRMAELEAKRQELLGMHNWQTDTVPAEPDKKLNILPDPTQFQQQLTEMREAFQNSMDEIFGEKAWLQGGWNELLDTDGFEEAHMRMDAAMRQNLFTHQQMAKMKKDLYRQEQQQMLDTASMAAQTITALFPKSKAAAIAAAGINTSLAITRTLAQVPFPYDLIQASLIAAQGAAQIASIRSTSLGGGGSVPSVSSSGGGASQSTAPAQQSNSSTLYVEGINPNSLFTGMDMRDFAQRLIDYQRQGGQIVLAPT